MLNAFFIFMICQSKAENPGYQGPSSPPPLVTTKLMNAASIGDLEKVKEIVKQMNRPPPEKGLPTKPRKISPLSASPENSDENQKIDPIDEPDRIYHLSAIDLALRGGHFPVVRYLLDQGSQPNWLADLHPLHRAIIFEDLAKIKEHLPFEDKSSNSIWPGKGMRIDILRIAAMGGNSEVLNLILANNPTSRSSFNLYQSLEVAVRLGHLEAVKLIFLKHHFIKEPDFLGLKNLAKDLKNPNVLDFLNTRSPADFKMPYGNPWRNLRSPHSPKFIAKVDWSSETTSSEEQRISTLLEFSDGIVLSTAESFQFYSLSGELRWTQKKAWTSHFFISNDLIFYGSRSSQLNSMDSKGKLHLDGAPLSVLPSNEWHLDLLAPYSDGFVSASFGISRSVKDYPNGVSKDIEKPVLFWRTGNFGQLFGPLFNGTDLEIIPTAPPLYLPHLNYVYFLTNDSFVWIDLAKPAEEIEEKPKPKNPVQTKKLTQQEIADKNIQSQARQEFILTPWFDETNNWSHNNYDQLTILGYKGEKAAIVGFDTLEKERWKWSGDKKDHTFAPDQPPIHSKDSMMYVLFKERLIKLYNSRTEWTFETTKEKPLKFLVENGDGTLLLTRGKELIHLDAAGKILATVDVEDEITSHPFVSKAGSVFLSTKSRIIKLKSPK